MTLITQFLAIKKPLDLLKIFLVYAAALLIAASPFIVAYIGSSIEEMLKGHEVHEGNSGFMALMWLFLISIPFGIFVLVFSTVVYIKNAVGFLRSKEV
jgi:hypothetical protein